MSYTVEYHDDRPKTLWNSLVNHHRPIGGAGYLDGGKLVQNTKREIFFKIEYFKRWAHLLCAFEMLKFIVNCYLLKIAVRLKWKKAIKIMAVDIIIIYYPISS